jgi:hypothetical protein
MIDRLITGVAIFLAPEVLIDQQIIKTLVLVFGLGFSRLSTIGRKYNTLSASAADFCRFVDERTLNFLLLFTLTTCHVI